MTTDEAYIGDELELFQHATNWKAYWRQWVTPHIRGDVLEVGAGLGGTTRALAPGTTWSSWTCIEPDPDLRAELDDSTRHLLGERTFRCLGSTVNELPMDEAFDVVMYIDVLEHIRDDRGELTSLRRHLRPGGHLIVLSPAHQWLFSPFDAAVGHERRYSRPTLRACIPEGFAEERLFYLDAVGLTASLANRAVLRQSQPTIEQIRTWDRVMVPASRVLDRLTRHRFGKTIVGIWTAG